MRLAPSSAVITNRGCLVLLMTLAFLGAPSLMAHKPRKVGKPAALEGKADDALKALKERLDQPRVNREQVRLDLLTLRQAFPGTAEAVEAAALVRRLASPLDKLDARAIPPLERYDWQPKGLVAVLGEHRGRHGNVVYCVASSLDGKLVASGGGNGLVRLWDPVTLRLKGILGHDSVVSALAFSKDSQWLVASSYAGTVRIWDVTEDKPKLVHHFTPSTGHLYGVAISPDGKLIACGGQDLLVRLWDVSGKMAKQWKVQSGHTKPVAAVAFSRSGRTLASAGYDGKVRLWRLAPDDVSEKAVLEASSKEVSSLAFDNDGRLLAAGTYEGTVRVWNVAGGKPRLTAVIDPKGGVVYTVAFAPSGKRLAIGCADYHTHVWEPAGQASRERFVLKGHDGYVSSTAYFKDGRTLVTGSGDWTVRLWGMTGRPREKFVPRGHLSWAYDVAVADDGRTVASGSYDKTVRLWSVNGLDCRERLRLKGEGVPIYSVAFAPDAKTVTAGGAGSTVRIWHTSNGSEIRKLTDFPGAVGSLAFTPDGGRLLACSLKLLCLWDVRSGRKVRLMDGHKINISAAAISPDGRRALTCAGYYKLDAKGQVVVIKGVYQYEDCTVRLWDLSSGRPVHTFAGDKPFNHVTFAPDGHRAASGNWYAGVETYDLVKPAMAGTLKGAAGHVFFVVHSPDGKQLATVGPDGLIIVWDLATAKRLYTWAMTEDIRRLAFSSDGRHLVIGLGTGPVYVVRVAGARLTAPGK